MKRENAHTGKKGDIDEFEGEGGVVVSVMCNHTQGKRGNERKRR